MRQGGICWRTWALADTPHGSSTLLHPGDGLRTDPTACSHISTALVAWVKVHLWVFDRA